MIRVTRHTRRKGPAKCELCPCGIVAGDSYRQLVATHMGDAFGSDYVRWLAHDDCADRSRHAEVWRLRDDDAPDTDPTCEYVRTRYGLDIRKGSRVTAGSYTGTVVGATHNVYVRPDGWKRGRHAIYHPSEISLCASADVAKGAA